MSSTRRVFRELSDVSKSSVKIKISSYGTHFVNLLPLAVTCKQRLLHGNKIVRCLQKCKCYNVAKTNLKSPYKVLQGS